MPNKFKIVSRCEARAAGLKRYFTGKPCKHGHVAERWTARGVCYECLRLHRTAPEVRIKILEKNREYDSRPEVALRKRVWRTSPLGRESNRKRTAEYRTTEKYRKAERVRQLNKVGFTVEMFNNLLVDQGGRCGCCGVVFSFKRKARADHCHDTNQPRGLLCHHCNLAEGLIKKTGLTPTEWGKRLQQYLDSHSLV